MRAAAACAAFLAALALALAAGGGTAPVTADLASAAAQELAAEGAAGAKARLCELAQQYAVELDGCKAAQAEAPADARPLPPEIEAVLRAALRDQAALGGGIASRSDPDVAATLAAGADPAAAGALTGLRPVRTRNLSTREVAGLAFGLVFSAAFCGCLVLLASRKERYGRFF